MDLDDGCMSSAVVKTSVRRVGIVVLRSIRRVITPPFVSMPSDSGVTSSSSTSLTSPRSTPAWIAAPTATTSSGLTDLFGSLPVRSIARSWIAGMRRAADEDDVVQVALGDPGVGQRLLERNAAALDEVGGHLLELRAAERLVEVQRAVRRSGDEGQVDLRLLDLAELDLRLLGGLLEALDGHPVARQVDAVGGLELLHEEVDDPLVPVVPTEVRVAVGRLDLEHAVADLEHGDVEGAAAEVEHEHGLVLRRLVEAVGEGSRGRLVDDPQHLEAGDLAGFLRGGALGVVEVRRGR